MKESQYHKKRLTNFLITLLIKLKVEFTLNLISDLKQARVTQV